MIRQLESGGFASYFYNTGHLAHLLLNALDKIGSTECKNIVTHAISNYGQIPSRDHDKMLDELDKIKDHFDNDLWETQDDRFYNLGKNIEKLLMDYTQNNSNKIR